jgi:DNA segregation ATPase FtsK/SpoIIIE-like protein
MEGSKMAKQITSAVRKTLAQMIQIEVRRALRGVERTMNKSIPGTGGRVMYVAIPGRGRNRRELSARATEVLSFIESHKNATSAAIQKGLKVNRNVIAGAMHELRQAGVVRSEPING